MDELEQCNKMVGKDDNRVLAVGTHSNDSRKFVSDGSKTKTYFPFKQGYLSVATLRVGTEGIQMTVDGKHITSFAVREVISPSLIDCHLGFLQRSIFVPLSFFWFIYLLSWLVIFSEFGAMAGQ